MSRPLFREPHDGVKLRELATWVEAVAAPGGGADVDEDEGDDLRNPDGSLIAYGGVDLGQLVIDEPEDVPLVTDLTATPGADDFASWIDVAWAPPAGVVGDDQVIGYAVEWTDVATAVSVESGLVTGVSYRVSPLAAGMYDVTVLAITRTGRASSGVTVAAVVVTVDTGAPATPTGLVVTAGLRSLVARWNPNAEPDVANGTGEYELRVAENAAMTTNLRTFRTGGTVVAVTDLVAGTTYHVDLMAVDASGNSSPRTAPPVQVTPGTVQGSDLAPGSIGSTQLAADSVLATHIAAGAVTADELAAASVVAGKVQAGAIGTNELAANSVTAAKLAAITLEVGKFLRSTNYVAGSTGFNFDGTTGSAELNSVTLRGSLIHSLVRMTPTLGLVLTASGAIGTPELTPASIRWFDDTFTTQRAALVYFYDVGTAYHNTLKFASGRLWVETAAAASLADLSGSIVIGVEGGAQVALDTDEILARDNGAAATLHLNRTSGGVAINATGGMPTTANPANVRAGTGNVLFTSTSSGRWKDVRGPLDVAALERFDRLRPVRFRSLHRDDDDRELFGFVAEDVEAVWPEATYRGQAGDTKVAEVDERQIVALTVAATQDLRRRVAALERSGG